MFCILDEKNVLLQASVANYWLCELISQRY